MKLYCGSRHEHQPVSPVAKTPVVVEGGYQVYQQQDHRLRRAQDLLSVSAGLHGPDIQGTTAAATSAE